jgi:D-alanine-D-alanine ligase-like ATP-grasp enzyme
MKKVLTDNKIPTSQYAILDKPDLKLVENFKFPLVVKPVDCNSSKGVKKVNGDKEFIEYVEMGAFNDRDGKATFMDANGIEIRTTSCNCDAAYLKKFKFKYKFIVWENNR